MRLQWNPLNVPPSYTEMGKPKPLPKPPCDEADRKPRPLPIKIMNCRICKSEAGRKGQEPLIRIGVHYAHMGCLKEEKLT